jgi:threonine dehydrogenase-like Zn-dependent dehydrogenase
MAVLHSFERALSLLARGVLDGEAMITHRLPLDDYAAAIDTFRQGAGLKVQVRPGLAC